MLDDGPLNYTALASNCRTKNEFRRLHIDLENTLAPGEICEIKKLTDVQDPDAPGRLWVGELQKLSPTVFDAPRPYGRRPLSPQATLYQVPSPSRAERGLIVAFSGNARRLMLPTCIILQHLDSRRWDVLVLRKNGGTSFLRGLEGVAKSFPELIRYVQSTVSARRYRRTVALGTSGGGSAAIMAALLLGADRGVSIGGNLMRSHPDKWLQRRIAWAGLKAAVFGRELWYVYGSDYSPDVEATNALRNRFGGELHPIPGADEHNVLRWLLERGRLAAFLEGIIE
jgi:hypothetical protein